MQRFPRLSLGQLGFARVCGTLILLLQTGCMEAYRKDVVGQSTQVYSKIYLTDFETAWAAVKEALKSSRIDVDNKEGGELQTRWTDNTTDRNFTDSFGGADVYLKSQYRFKISLVSGTHEGRSSVKVSIQKDQLIKKDVLEGWRPVESDSTEENTLLYRIGRLIFMRMKMNEQEEVRKKREMEVF